MKKIKLLSLALLMGFSVFSSYAMDEVEFNVSDSEDELFGRPLSSTEGAGTFSLLQGTLAINALIATDITATNFDHTTTLNRIKATLDRMVPEENAEDFISGRSFRTILNSVGTFITSVLYKILDDTIAEKTQGTEETAENYRKRLRGLLVAAARDDINTIFCPATGHKYPLITETINLIMPGLTKRLRALLLETETKTIEEECTTLCRTFNTTRSSEDAHKTALKAIAGLETENAQRALLRYQSAETERRTYAAYEERLKKAEEEKNAAQDNELEEEN